MSELQELTGKRDGARAYRYSDESVRDAAMGSWDMATRECAPMEWVVDDDLDQDETDSDLAISPGLLAELVRLARIGARYAGCTACERTTHVG